MATVRCPQCGTEFEREGASFCPNPGCGYPVEFMEGPKEEPPEVRMERRPGEDVAAPVPTPEPQPVTTPLEPVTQPAVPVPPPPKRKFPVAIVAAALGGAAAVAVAVLLLTRSDGDGPIAVRTPEATATKTTQGEYDLRRAEPSSVHASSVLPPIRGNTYEPENTVDGDTSTAWNHNGRHDRAIGQTLTYSFGSQARIVRIEIVNGYARTEQLFRNNGRVRSIKIFTDTGTFDELLDNTSSPQSLEADFGPTTTVTIQIEAIYDGDKYPDVALSEIVFFAERE